jgi:imidazolonepropionase-like amidohydrolase
MVLLLCALAATSLESAEAPKTLVIRGARIISPTAGVTEKGGILIEGDRIQAVGRDVPGAGVVGGSAAVGVGGSGPESADINIIDAAGKTVTPGFIDVHSSLGMVSGGPGGPTKRAADAFDRYALATLREALARGVTAAHASCRGSAGFQGIGAVIRLVPRADGSLGEALVADAVLEIDMGSQVPALSRISLSSSIRGQFRAALDYRESLEAYREDVAEYEKKLKERAEKKAKEKGKEKTKEGEKEFRGATEAKPGAAVPPPQPGGEAKPGPEPKKPEAEALQKPARPRRNPSAEILLRAIDRKLPVWIEAHRSEDILNALDIGREFCLDIVLAGATEAHLVADEIASAGARVVLGNQVEGETSRQTPYRRLAEIGAVLSRTGVRWWVGSGAESGLDARFVMLNAQIAAASAAGAKGAGAARADRAAEGLSLVTAEAAKLLGLELQIGDVRPGMLADLVIWSGDPREPGSRVERVLVGGKVAYEAPGEEAEE